MLKKTITYTDYDGNERTEDFYFNFSEAELMDMQLETEGGFGEYIQKIVDAKDKPELVRLFRKMVVESYGEKSPDGRRFVKSPEIQKAFMETPAYSIIYMELATNDGAASDFINHVIPAVKEAGVVKSVN